MNAVGVLRIVIIVALALSVRTSAASAVTSRILIDPAGEHTGDNFGGSVAWVGDVNGDGYDDVLIGAFRYPEIACGESFPGRDSSGQPNPLPFSCP